MPLSRRHPPGTVVRSYASPRDLYYITTEPGTVIQVGEHSSIRPGYQLNGLREHIMMIPNNLFWEVCPACPVRIRKYVPEEYRA